MQIKLAGMHVKDFWTFIEANDILDRLYRLSKMYDKMNAQEQIVFLSEAEKVFSAFIGCCSIIYSSSFASKRKCF